VNCRLALAALIALLAFPAHAAVDPGKRCSAAKLRATAKALLCEAKEQNKLLLGRPADLAKCHNRLTIDFSNAEEAAGGTCPTTGDAATTVDPLVTTVETDVLTALMASAASNTPEKACAVAKNQGAAKYTVCHARVLSTRLLGAPCTTQACGNDFDRCLERLGQTFVADEKKGGCLTSGDAIQVSSLASRAGSYLRAANLHLAALLHADVRGGDLRNADLSGADLLVSCL